MQQIHFCAWPRSMFTVCIFGRHKSAFAGMHHKKGKHWKSLHPCHSSHSLQYSLLQVQSSPLWCDKWFRVKVDKNKWLIQGLTRKSLQHQTALYTTIVWDTVLLGTSFFCYCSYVRVAHNNLGRDLSFSFPQWDTKTMLICYFRRAFLRDFLNVDFLVSWCESRTPPSFRDLLIITEKYRHSTNVKSAVLPAW